MSSSLGRALFLALGLLVPLVGCGGDASGSSSAAVDAVDSATIPAAGDPATFGPHAVAHRRVVIEDAARGRSLPVELWLPIAQVPSSTPDPVSAFEPDDNGPALATLLAEAPTCTTSWGTRALAQGEPIATGLPLLVLSHCHGCVRWWAFSLAEHLAAQGFVVAAVDHVGNTVFDTIAGNPLPLGPKTLLTREQDVAFVVDRLLAGDAAFPAAVTAAIDPDRVGAIGHSFGAVTVGRLATIEPRIRAVAALGAPMQNPLLAGVDVPSLKQPQLYVLLAEDNSIGTIGNDFLRSNYEAATAPAWLLEVADAGHWSVSDIAGMTDAFAPGCGTGKRMKDGSAFVYPPPAEVQLALAPWLAAFFRSHLQQDATASAWLATPPTLPRITWSQRTP